MGIIRRPVPVKLEDKDTPADEIVCIINKNDNGNNIEIICVPEELIIENKPVEELKSKTVITSSTTGEQFGTWTPVLYSTGTINVNIRNAFYTKVGQLVTCTFDIIVNNMSGGKKDSSIILGGLPITSIGSPNAKAGSSYISYFNLSNPEVRMISGTINGNDSRVELWCERRGQGGLVSLTQLDINVNTVLVGTVTYISNS